MPTTNHHGVDPKEAEQRAKAPNKRLSEDLRFLGLEPSPCHRPARGRGRLGGLASLPAMQGLQLYQHGSDGDRLDPPTTSLESYGRPHLVILTI